jgi:hypothetical protein
MTSNGECRRAAEMVGMSFQEFLDWSQSFEEDLIVLDEFDDETGDFYKKLIYTDGDEGVMILGPSQEGRNGISITLVGCSYVEITPNVMKKLLKEFK